MRALRPAALALLLALGGPAGAAETITIDELSLEMDARDADVLFKKYFYDTSTFPVTVVEPDGQRLTGRIEVKGETARVFAKKPVLIKLDKPHKWRGHSRISLNAMATDSSMIREWLSWRLIYALGLPAPDTGYVRLRINDADKGMFYRIEWVGPNVFERYGYGKEGELYDPVDRISCADLSPASVADPERCWVKITPGDGNFTSLQALVAAIDAEPVETIDAFLERNFAAQTVIDWIVVTALVENLTTYNNEYWPFLSQKLGKWVVMPWDYDRTFGKNFDPDLPYPQNKINDNFQYYYPVEVGASNALRDKLFKNGKTSRRIHQRVLEIIEGTPDAQHPWRGWWDPQRMQARIEALRQVLAPEVLRDPAFAGAPRRFEDDVASVRHFAVARAHYLRRVLAHAGAVTEPNQGSIALPAAGQTAHLADAWGYMLARVTPREAKAGALGLKVHRGWPELVPPEMDRAACVQRTWFLSAPAGFEGDLMVEYLQEVTRTSELGARVGDEKALTLYARDAKGWWRLPTGANPLANTLEARVRFPDDGKVRLVACSAPPSPDLAAR